MDPESKELLQETLKLTQENNQMLHSMRRSMQLSRVMSYIYWVFIIGSALGLYYYIEPYLTQVLEVYSGATDTINTFRNFGQ